MEKPLPTKPSHSDTRDFIAKSVAPVIAITASEDAEELCRVNHIPSFADFIKPFGDMIEGRGNCFIQNLDPFFIHVLKPLCSHPTRLARCAHSH